VFEPKLSVTVKEIVVSLIPVERSERPALTRVNSSLPITCAIRCDACTHPPPVTRVEAGAIVLRTFECDKEDASQRRRSKGRRGRREQHTRTGAREVQRRPGWLPSRAKAPPPPHDTASSSCGRLTLHPRSAQREFKAQPRRPRRQQGHGCARRKRSLVHVLPDRAFGSRTQGSGGATPHARKADDRGGDTGGGGRRRVTEVM
jgi:hypothetical protein